MSSQARAIVGQVRDVTLPAGARVYVGGTTAQLVDELSSLGAMLPWMALVVVLATFVLLFLAFGSVVLPVKAIVMNAASLSATFGVVVWIFQEGHLSGLLLVIVIGAFSASGITFIKLMGIGMIVALIVDATIVRILLVPATMRLLGRANWWAPRPLRRLYGRYGIREGDGDSGDGGDGGT